MDSHAVWQGVLGEIEVTVSSSSFTAWFKNTKLEIISDKEVLIIAPNIFARTQLEKRFHPQILEALLTTALMPHLFPITSNLAIKNRALIVKLIKVDQQEPAKPLILPSKDLILVILILDIHLTTSSLAQVTIWPMLLAKRSPHIQEKNIIRSIFTEVLDLVKLT